VVELHSARLNPDITVDFVRVRVKKDAIACLNIGIGRSKEGVLVKKSQYAPVL
jgi:hypothetical protein